MSKGRAWMGLLAVAMGCGQGMASDSGARTRSAAGVWQPATMTVTHDECGLFAGQTAFEPPGSLLRVELEPGTFLLSEPELGELVCEGVEPDFRCDDHTFVTDLRESGTDAVLSTLERPVGVAWSAEQGTLLLMRTTTCAGRDCAPDGRLARDWPCASGVSIPVVRRLGTTDGA